MLGRIKQYKAVVPKHSNINSHNMVKLVLIVLLCKIRPLVGHFNISNILRPGYDPASLPADLVNVQVGSRDSQLLAII
jgi:hypothetical protein